jgi:PAS domain S-box-containing protein
MYVTYLLLLGLAIYANVILIIVLYRHNQKNVTITSLLILLVLIIIWFTPKFIMNAFHPKDVMFEVLSRIAALGYVLVPVTFLTFTIAYSRYQRIVQSIWYWAFVLIPTIFFLFLSWTTNLVGVHEYSQVRAYPWGYETPTGSWWSVYMSWFDGMMALSLGVLIYTYFKLEDEARKRQTFYIILAVLIPFVVGTITSGILPLLNIFVFPIGLIILNLTAVIGVALIYRYGWFMVSPFNILASINQVIITVDKHLNIVQMNPYTEKILGVKSLAVAGQPIQKVLTLEGRNKKSSNQFQRLLEPVFEKGKSLTVDSYSVLNKRKKIFASAISVSPIISREDVIGANLFMRDTTREKEREKLKDDYFSMLTHELRTPLTSIKAYNQLLLSQSAKTDEKQKQLLLKVDDQVSKVTRLIHDFFELSRLQSGKMKVEKEYFDFDFFIKNLKETLNVTYKGRKIVVKGETNSVVFADPDRIEQVIINLVTNAIKFSNTDKDIIIHLSNDGKNIVLGVQDFGAGIDAKYHKKIFKRFFQIQDVSVGKAGIGMGLFISCTFIKAHEGKIWVESEIGKGSTFYFSLPIK